MNLHKISPKLAVKHLYKQRLVRTPFEKFVADYDELQSLVFQSDESEEYLKNELSKFLVENFYRNYHINTKGKIDLAIYLENCTAGVLFEIKKPNNATEMISIENPNRKALHELILYYFDEREAGNNEIKYLVVTNLIDWFIFDANEFDAKIYQSTPLKKLYQNKINDKKDNLWFYEELKLLLDKLETEIEVIHFQSKNNNDLQPIYKIFSPDFLLKLPVKNDSNSLDQGFYEELLHILGLIETTGNIKLIQRKKEKERFIGSLLESVIIELEDIYDENQQFEIALELVITWINRILFLKLLEGQLTAYHPGEQKYNFLNTKIIKSFNELNDLFFKVLAVQNDERNPLVKNDFSHIPYLNSSLFEKSETENNYVQINQLTETFLPFFHTTILKDRHGKKLVGQLSMLDYLFRFLDAYDFGSNNNELQEDNKPLINSAVLGLIFEKINGYKDGSFFTPGLITMYMCRETLRHVVVQKFNEINGWNCKTFIELQNKMDTIPILEANKTINSIRICDPSVGSGHFLVSALNEIIAIKHDLKILCDKTGKRLIGYYVEIVDDELVILNDNADRVIYNPRSKESNTVQETLFSEKQILIENCLFGVDINPNSVKICQLRLWIELLKNAYYKEDGQLDTLPNIDINIKCGNSLISQFDIQGNYSNVMNGTRQKLQLATQKYKEQVIIYKSTTDKRVKKQTEQKIAELKQIFSQIVNPTDPDYQKLKRTKARLGEVPLFFSREEQEKWKAQVELLTLEVEDLQTKYDTKLATIYKRSFEWSFEFPEVLDDNGNFIGFDIIMGNPPYIDAKKLKSISAPLKERYVTYSGTADLSIYFTELGYTLCKNNGYINFITTNKFFTTEYGKLVRKSLIEKQITQIINFEQVKIFDEALVSSVILGFKKESPNNENLLKYHKFYKLKNKDFQELFLQNKDNFGTYSQNLLDENEWSFADNSHRFLKNKIEENSTLLKNLSGVSVYRGVTTGYNPAFIINEEQKNELIKSDVNNAKIIKPLLQGRNIRKWAYHYSNHYLIFTKKGINIEKYPLIKNHLKFFVDNLKPKVELTENGRKPGCYQWFEIQDNTAYFHEFEESKIIWGLTADKWAYAYDDKGHYLPSNGYILTSKKTQLKYLLALLNSKLLKYYFGFIGVMTAGGAYTLKHATIQELPIKLSKKQDKFIDLVDKILIAKQDNSQVDTTTLEIAIDQLVYNLYGLTPAEIAIVESI